MKQFNGTFLLTACLLVYGTAHAWNFGSRHINHVRFSSNGTIQFSLIEDENATVGDTIRCEGNSPWYTIRACSVGDVRCEAANNRMASMLLTAQATEQAVWIQRDMCTVTEVAVQ